MKVLSRDIHNHLLPGVDDGFQTADESLRAICRLSELGCRDLVFTPHMNPDVYPEMNETVLRERYAEFCNLIPSGINHTLAAEYMCVPGFEERAGDPELLTYPDGSILIEMSYLFPSSNIENVIFNLVMEDKKPILAHPERYLYMVESGLDRFERFVDMGCRLQMNLLSATGVYGHESLKIMKYLLDNDLYSFAATDLHSVEQLALIEQRSPEKKIARDIESLFERIEG